jgi:hypothetical protein
VVEVIEENHDEPNNKDNLMLKMIEGSIDDEEVHIKELPAKPPDRSVALNRGGYARANTERRRIQTNLLRPPPSPEPPDANRLATVLSRRALLHKLSYLNGRAYVNLCVISVDG